VIQKLGLILECDAGGPDELVFKCLVRRLSPETKVLVRTQGNKPAVFERGADVAKSLVETDGCDLVLVVWDLKPLFEDAGNCVDETDDLKANLAGLPPETRKRVKLLCLSYELETWLLADAEAVRGHLSKPTRPCKWKGSKSPETFSDAKSTLNKVFKDFRGQRYEDFREAIQIASRWSTTTKFRGVSSFERFVNLLTGDPASDFQLDGSVCDDLCHSGQMMGRN